MVAVLKPVSYTIERPTFDNENLGSASKWTRDNYAALVEYYRALGKTLSMPDDDNADAWAKSQGFCSWIMCQWDREIFRSAN
jgi:hypothetical protein